MSYLSTRPYRKRLPKRGKRISNPYRKKGKWTAQDFTRYAGYAYTAYKTAKYLKQLVNVEEKVHDYASIAGTFDYNGTIHTLNAPAQGDGDTTRDGDSMKNQSVGLKIQFTANAAADHNVRMIIFWDKQNTVSAGSDLLEITGTSDAPYSFKKHDTRFESKVLYDVRFVLSANSPESGKFHLIDIPYIKLNKHTQFNAGTTTINTGALKLLVICGGVTTNLPTVSVYSRLKFTDN